MSELICKKCSNVPTLEFVWDDGNKYAYNVYLCSKCGRIFKENVWENKGIMSIAASELDVDLKI